MTKTISPTELTQFCDTLLQAEQFSDYCPNGLQVDADRPIRHIIAGVTASQALIDHAVSVGADCLLVHHGYFWKGESAPLTGMKGKRIRTLMTHGISLIAYHLPLDAHPTLGNNAALADMLGLTITGALYPHEKFPVGNIATLPKALPTAEFAAIIERALGRKPLHIAGGRETLKTIGICTGGAQDMIEQAAKMGCDAFISGEISERTTHAARELGLEYFAAGHHATERGGVQRLGEYIAKELSLQVEFVDIDNPA
ncbi:Nif3-like dinuclear metal center hexameric protein [Moraxella caviae]|uniref:GTP cyclohydrolase 1 type 2 homolog n=1 Tax=Moraxella caviae TaxID=34060 RepID=A0A1S9ZUW9_9GAMM|nr:Nif3-like dinuclear metal center hexameric protein [Moraxella caviae]OOR87306.1 Nif3-like dinuclear metal center hexameric protein [Moraxella caviae]STZ14630.1 metal-binding protein [Moraxella caviae]VEW11399.1 metal-binding protein [Moraxella caviae]